MSTNKTPKLADLEQPYLTYLRTERRMRPLTLLAHSSDLRHFLAWQKTQKAQRWTQVLNGYFAVHSDWTVTTARIKRLRLNRFLKFARENGHPSGLLREHNERPLGSERAPKVRDQLDIDMIFAAIPPSQLRDALLFRLLYFASLRISEATRLRVEDVEIHNAFSMTIRFIRNGRSMFVEVEQAWLAAHFTSYLAGRAMDEYLFRAAKYGRSEPLKQQSLHKRWLAYARQVNLSCSMEELRISSLQHLRGQRLPSAF